MQQRQCLKCSETTASEDYLGGRYCSYYICIPCPSNLNSSSRKVVQPHTRICTKALNERVTNLEACRNSLSFLCTSYLISSCHFIKRNICRGNTARILFQKMRSHIVARWLFECRARTLCNIVFSTWIQLRM